MSGIYKTEQRLVNHLLRVLRSESNPWGPVRLATEFFYARGRSDVLALRRSSELIAFEAKLAKWREALDQAYRNTCFSHRSFVILPERVAMRALVYQQEFTRRKVGLCYIYADALIVAIPAPRILPLQPQLANQARRAIKEVHE